MGLCITARAGGAGCAPNNAPCRKRGSGNYGFVLRTYSNSIAPRSRTKPSGPSIFQTIACGAPPRCPIRRQAKSIASSYRVHYIRSLVRVCGTARKTIRRCTGDYRKQTLHAALDPQETFAQPQSGLSNRGKQTIGSKRDAAASCLLLHQTTPTACHRTAAFSAL